MFTDIKTNLHQFKYEFLSDNILFFSGCLSTKNATYAQGEFYSWPYVQIHTCADWTYPLAMKQMWESFCLSPAIAEWLGYTSRKVEVLCCKPPPHREGGWTQVPGYHSTLTTLPHVCHYPTPSLMPFMKLLPWGSHEMELCERDVGPGRRE